jgi:xylulokinase
LAAVGSGVWSEVATACQEVVKISECTAPDEKQVEIYRVKYPLYRELYPALKSAFHEMS